jgi:hypothetical protein
MPPLWIPPSEEMVMNLDPSVASSLTLDPLVAHIDDLSGSGHGATVGGTKPALSSGAINGLDALSLTGIQYMNIEGGGVACGQQMICFSVFTRATASISSSPLGGIDGQYTGWWPFYWVTNNIGISSYGDSSLFLPASTATGSFLVTTIVNGTSITVRRNGLQWGTNPSMGTRGPIPMNILGRTGWSGYWHNGLIGQMVICDSIVDYVKYEGYLAHKWGVTLDATHEYFALPPYDSFWTNFKGQSEI